MRPTARKRLATRMEAGCRRFGLFGFGLRFGLRRYASQPPTPSFPRRRESTSAFKPRLRLPSARQWRAINGCFSAEARAASSRFGTGWLAGCAWARIASTYCECVLRACCAGCQAVSGSSALQAVGNACPFGRKRYGFNPDEFHTQRIKSA